MRAFQAALPAINWLIKRFAAGREIGIIETIYGSLERWIIACCS